ncbi:hypothetical protein M5K25_018944 [Dendrobium thyrsiflorum]|uniref:Importin-7/11-like TPR repeats domain-containing protein n=1 Tax=Dendrobium thyrsiflorum TaxID=117978 RepID=A0ABD0UDR3_DENTH
MATFAEWSLVFFFCVGLSVSCPATLRFPVLGPLGVLLGGCSCAIGWGSVLTVGACFLAPRFPLFFLLFRDLCVVVPVTLLACWTAVPRAGLGILCLPVGLSLPLFFWLTWSYGGCWVTSSFPINSGCFRNLASFSYFVLASYLLLLSASVHPTYIFLLKVASLCFPLEAPPLISGVIQKLILLCLSGEDDRNPSRTAVRTSSGAILARLLVMNTNYLGHLASEPSLILALQQAGLSINQNILLCLVDLWIDKIDNTTCIQRKTYASALSIILTLRLPEVIDKIDEILSVCTTVILGGTEDSSKEDSSGDAASSSWPSNESLGYYNGVPSKELRRRQIKDSDPIKHISLQSMLRDNLNACAAFHGESSFHEAMSRMHPSAFAQLQQALKMA